MSLTRAKGACSSIRDDFRDDFNRTWFQSSVLYELIEIVTKSLQVEAHILASVDVVQLAWGTVDDKLHHNLKLRRTVEFRTINQRNQIDLYKNWLIQIDAWVRT
jgi:hypothetical protein